MSDWQPIATAPRDGTEILLTWMENGTPAEIYPMRWNPFASNPLVQSGNGMWAMHDLANSELLVTWSETDPDGAPTHWRAIPAREA